MLDDLIARIAEKKAAFDRLRPLSTGALRQLQKHFDVELTYTSNAIEGNTLTLRKTAEVIEHGLTVGGKRLRDHLEAVDHYEALQWMRQQATGAAPPGEATVCELHRRIVARSQPEIAGVYSRHPRRIAGSPVVFPNPAKIPDLIRGGYPPIAVRPEDRRAYLDALERASLAEDFGAYRWLLHERLDATLMEYLAALSES
jgi:Fic family protein